MNAPSAPFQKLKPAPWEAYKNGYSGDLPDLNVWLALVLEEHPHHKTARSYWTVHWHKAQSSLSNGQSLWFCRATMLGLIRMLTSPKIMGDGVMALNDAYSVYLQMRATSGVGYLPDAEGADANLQSLIAASSLLTKAPPAHFLNDAWLAASANSAGLRLVTFDGDFNRFNLRKLLVLPKSEVI